MTLIESYKKATAAKNAALTQKLKATTDALKAKITARQQSGGEQLREAYASYLQKQGLSAQQNRAAGRQGGAAVNQKAGTSLRHQADRDALRADMTADIADLNSDIQEATAATQKQIADNNTALTQKVEAQTIKEQQAAQKKAQSQKKTTKTTKNTTTKNDVIKLMKMGIYESSFAGILGISDQQVRDYVDEVNGKKKNQKNTTIYPGTQKQPLR